ncbi:MAG: carbohydrate porin [Verrucomicrobiales bacterium]
MRSDLAARGITADLSLTGYYAGLFQGGVADGGFDFGGRADAFLNFDFEKLGLWERGGFRTHLESRFGEAADRRFPRSGGIWPQNTGIVLPLGEPDRLVASSLYFTQGIGDRTNLLLGKINVEDLLARDPFFGGWGRDRFTNLAFVAPPSGVVPPTIMGGILNYQAAPLTFTFMAFDPDDRTNDYWPDDLFSSGVNLSLAATWSGEIADRISSIGITGTYSTKDGADLGDFLLPPDLKGGTKQGSYNVALSVSHLLYEIPGSPGKGFGVYAKAAVADGNPNPIRGSFVGGFAGHGIIPSRPDDSFGIGYYSYNLSDELQGAFSPLGPAFSINDEKGVEIYYNLAVTPWFRVTADVQWIDPARAVFPNAWVGGLRASLSF